ncbi:MAG: dTDP-4-dehydrorhamnose reductase [Paracoccaceae bacterium]
MKALVFGKTGQVARELAKVLPTAQFLGRDEADLAHPEACAQIIAGAKVDLVINAAAYTAVDRAETEEDAATVINGHAPGAMAQAAAARGIPFLHVSTDYVFDGTGTNAWAVGDATAPLGAYGRSKLAGEETVRAAGGAHVILRTSWVVSAHGANFVKTMLRLGRDRDSLTVVADQVGGPTPAADIARALAAIGAQMVAGHRGGTYHFSGAPDVSWADFAREIFRQSGLGCQVRDIPASDYPTPARRPENSRLDCSALARDFGIDRPDWRLGLHDILTQLEG